MTYSRFADRETMAKQKSIGAYRDPHDDLYAQIEERRRRHLFLPNVLDEAAKDLRLRTDQREAAYQIIRKWWQLAQDGKLNRKETSIDDKFLSEVFGEALGYQGVTEAAGDYERERQFHVPGVGPCDGALGKFPKAAPENVRVIIELKGAQTHLDRDRSNGRTAVQQLWDYLIAMPESCVWGIVSNFTTIRLYHRAKGSQVYEQFRMKELAQDREAFDRFYAVFEPYGLLRPMLHEPPRALGLLERTARQQREVGDELYKYYSEHRLDLIEHLHRQKGLPLDAAIRIAQKLIDRVLFIAFCENRKLVKARCIAAACKFTAMYTRERNPVWQNFLGLFHEMDKGGQNIGVENGYNGGLFAEEPDYPIENLDLDDVPWTQFFRGLAGFDYEHTVDVDVLGHLFERSVTELERLRQGVLFAKDQAPIEAPLMPKSQQRKLFGIYYTPVEFTTAIVAYTIDELVAERFAAVGGKHGLTDQQVADARDPKVVQAYWRDCLDVLRNLKVCDPACGSGAFLIRAYDALYRHYTLAITALDNLGDKKATRLLDDVPDEILRRNLYGVDLQPEAVEIAQLSLWLRTARAGKTLAKLSENIVCGNSLTDDPAVNPRAMDWAKTFPQAFAGDNPGFDCIIGNPPWERLKLQEREFFALSAPEIAAAVSAADRRRQIAAMETENPELFATYREALANADRMLTYVRESKRYPLTGKGDINTYVLFAELAMQIVSPTGRVGLLVPSGIATDMTTAKFFNKLMSGGSLQRLYDFENKQGLFADVHRAFKFSILNFRGAKAKSDAADFVFFAHALDELKDRQRHISLSSADMKLMNPNTKTCPIFRRRRDAEITKAIYGRVPVLIDRNRKEGGNPWGLRFVTMFHQTNDAELFKDAEALQKERCREEGNRWGRGKNTFLPLYEAKMVRAYDHRAASVEVVKSNWVRQGQTIEPTLVQRQNPEHVAMPRWWVDEEAVTAAIGKTRPYFLGFKDITSPTNQRTMIAAAIPWSAVTNHFVLAITEQEAIRECCLLANLNSMAYDFVVRQKIGGITLNFFIVEQLPTLPPDAYDERCPWDPKQTLEKWISSRVLKLSCTANDMKPLAQAFGMKPPVHKWNVDERNLLLAELDAAYFILYGVDREDMIYMLTAFQGTRSKGMPDLFRPDPDKMLSEAGQRIVEAYDTLRAG
jgi:hypothetical protein